jgi:chemotaxis methyl-accepting protein methylase
MAEVESAAPAVAKLLEHLKSTRGFDFGAYKITGLLRRIQKRMREVGVTRTTSSSWRSIRRSSRRSSTPS